MNTYDLAHRFFHEPQKRGEYANVNTSFYYNERTGERYYYSYATIIAEIKKDKNGNEVLVISDHRYSSNTGKHLNQLHRANPGLPVLNVPRVASGYYYTIHGAYDFETILNRIESFSKKANAHYLNQMEWRMYVTRNLMMFDKYVERMGDMDKKLIRLRNHKAIADVEEVVRQKNAALEARRNHVPTPEELAERERANQKRKERVERKIAEYFGEGDSLEKLKAVYSGHRYYRMGIQYIFDNVKDEGLKKAMTEYRKMLDIQHDNQGRYLSYVWLEEDRAVTSQHCQAPIEDVKRLLHMWKRHQSMLGEKAGIYSVVENDANHVKIGCHVIPAWNIELLCNKLQIAA